MSRASISFPGAVMLRKSSRIALSAGLAMAFACSLALADAPPATPEPAPASATPPKPQGPCAVLFGGGSPDVLVEGDAAARTGDGICVQVIDGARSVFTNGRPTLRVGDRVLCPNGRTGVIEGGAASVFIEGRPAATARSRITGCD